MLGLKKHIKQEKDVKYYFKNIYCTDKTKLKA